MARWSGAATSAAPHTHSALRPDLKTSIPVDGGRPSPSRVKQNPSSLLRTVYPSPHLVSVPSVSPLSYRPASAPLGRVGAPASSLIPYRHLPQAARASIRSGRLPVADPRDRGAEPSGRRCVEGRKIRQRVAHKYILPPDPSQPPPHCIWSHAYGARTGIGGATPTPTPIPIQIPLRSSTAAGTGSRCVQLRATPTPRAPALSRIRRTRVCMRSVYGRRDSLVRLPPALYRAYPLRSRGRRVGWIQVGTIVVDVGASARASSARSRCGSRVQSRADGMHAWGRVYGWSEYLSLVHPPSILRSLIAFPFRCIAPRRHAGVACVSTSPCIVHISSFPLDERITGRADGAGGCGREREGLVGGSRYASSRTPAGIRAARNGRSQSLVHLRPPASSHRIPFLCSGGRDASAVMMPLPLVLRDYERGAGSVHGMHKRVLEPGTDGYARGRGLVHLPPACIPSTSHRMVAARVPLFCGTTRCVWAHASVGQASWLDGRTQGYDLRAPSRSDPLLQLPTPALECRSGTAIDWFFSATGWWCMTPGHGREAPQKREKETVDAYSPCCGSGCTAGAADASWRAACTCAETLLSRCRERKKQREHRVQRRSILAPDDSNGLTVVDTTLSWTFIGALQSFFLGGDIGREHLLAIGVTHTWITAGAISLGRPGTHR